MKQMKRRLIAGAMIAFTILLALIIGSIVAFGQIQMEHESTVFIDQLLRESPVSPLSFGPPEIGPESDRSRPPTGYYDIEIDQEGQIIRQDAIGIFNQNVNDIAQVVQKALQDNRTRGSINVYKFGKEELSDSVRIILMDNSVQTMAMRSILRSAIIVGLGCLFLMFIILQPIAHYLARSTAASQERERQFITNASHELKTPVAVIQSNLEAMEMMLGENKWSRNAHDQVLRLNYLISQLLMMERIDEQRHKQKPVPINLHMLIKSVSAEMQELTVSRNLSLNIICEQSPVIPGYQDAMTQMLRILLDNAIKYASSNSQIDIRLTAQKKELLLSCENQVDILPACEPKQLFERFHRGGIRRQQGDLGCGIGLSAAADITAMHHGHIEAFYPDDHTFRILVTIPQR